MPSTLCSMSTSPPDHYPPSQKTCLDTKTVTSWTIDAAARRSHAISHQRQREAQSAWVRMTTLARDRQMDTHTTIEHPVAKGEIEVQIPTHLEVMMTGEGRLRERLVARASDKTGRGRERTEAHRPSTGFLLVRPICHHDRARRIVVLRLPAEEIIWTLTFQITTADRHAITTEIEEEEAIRASPTAALRIVILIVLLLVIETETAIPTATEIMEAIQISGGHEAGVQIERGVSGRNTRGESDCRTVSASFIDDEANAHLAVDPRKARLF